MSKTIKYSIEFYSYWHCGSGLAAGASMDATVVKDADDLPFVPGKTIKGLVREAVEEFSDLSDEQINKAFGTRVEGEGDSSVIVKGDMFFGNATISPDECSQIKKGKLQPYLYTTLASTAIDDNGIAQDASLRTIEVTVPCTLQGEITDVADDVADVVGNSLRMIKRLGLNRNRGLGRCDFKLEKEDNA